MSSANARPGTLTLKPSSDTRPLPPRPSDNPQRLPPPSRPKLPVASGGARPSRSSQGQQLPTVAPPSSRPTDSVGRSTLALGDPFRVIGPFADSLFLFEARNHCTGRRVVAKLFKTTGGEGMLAQEFARFAALRAPTTVRLLDFGIANTPTNVGYWIREYVDGVSLQQRLIWGEAFATDDALGIARDIALSLAEAHELGIVHGRLWPEHVLLEKQRSPLARARLLGYGQASAGVRRDPAAWFLAPELLRGGAAAPSADTFAVAAIFYACLFGQAPTLGGGDPGGDNASLWQRPGVAEFFEGALAAGPARRFCSAAALLDGLEAVERALLAEQAPTLRAALWCEPCESIERALRPPRDELMSTRDSSIWVLEGDASVCDPVVGRALRTLAQQHRVLSISSEHQEDMLTRLREGTLAPPWVVVFGDLSVLLDDPLLALLGECGESSRLLVSSHDDFDLLQNSINRAGLDQHVSLPISAEEFCEVAARMVQRTRRVYHHYDAIRIELKKTREQVGELSRNLAAAHPTVVPSQRKVRR